MLVSDVTWVTDGVLQDHGVVVSNRDRNIPRKIFVDKITGLLRDNDVKFQMEVEAYGASDGREIQQSPYPIDWCFIGAAAENAHSSAEKVAKSDVQSMMLAYRCLFEKL